MSKIVYLYVRPFFLYYFLLIATMTKTKFANSQQLLSLILLMCEVISIHKINMNSFILFILFFYLPKIMAKQSSPRLNTNICYIAHRLDYKEGS